MCEAFPTNFMWLRSVHFLVAAPAEYGLIPARVQTEPRSTELSRESLRRLKKKM